MLPVMHRVNTVADLLKTPVDMGVESDLRSNGREIFLHHDAFASGDTLENFISHYNHKFIILDVKAEGIEQKAIEIVEAAGIKDYFLLNVNFPFVMKLSKMGIKKMSVRFSEFEDVKSCLNMVGKVDYVWVESFNNFALTKEIYDQLSRHFKISLVSPELYGRHEISAYQKLLAGMKIHDVCTDFPDQWKGFDS